MSGKKVAVIGGGLTGLETAECLCNAGNKVTVYEMAGEVGTAMYRSVKNMLVKNIEEKGGKIMVNSLFKEIKDGKIVINEIQTGFDKEYDADAVVVALGVKPNHAQIDSFNRSFDKVSVAGDTIAPGNIADATHSGYDKAFVF